MDMYAFIVSPWLWLALMIVCTLIELTSACNLITIWFALSALIMIFVSGLTGFFDAAIRFRLHIGLFLGMAIVLLVFTRPLAVKKLKVGTVKTNADALVEKTALVTVKIERFGKGEIKVMGQTWTAITEDNSELKKGTKCTVIKIEGVKAIVKASPHD